MLIKNLVSSEVPCTLACSSESRGPAHYSDNGSPYVSTITLDEMLTDYNSHAHNTSIAEICEAD